MLIKCQGCGHENQLGNIFCRNCGEKLDIDASRPEVKDRKSDNNIFAIVKRVIMLVIFLGVIYVIYASFVPAGSADAPILSDADKATADKKLESISKRMQGKLSEGDKFALTADEATYLLNRLAPVEGNFVVVKVAGTSVLFAVTMKLADYVPVRYTVIGAPSNPEDASSDRPISLAVGATMLGQLNVMPYFGLGDLVIDKFKPVYTNEKVRGLLTELARIEVNDEGKITLVFKEKKKDKK